MKEFDTQEGPNRDAKDEDHKCVRHAWDCRDDRGDDLVEALDAFEEAKHAERAQRAQQLQRPLEWRDHIHASDRHDDHVKKIPRPARAGPEGPQPVAVEIHH